VYSIEKIASTADSRRDCESIMERIRTENPSYWPHGLSVAHHDELFLIRSASDRRAIGFTGWQTLPEKGRRIGYYSIGILPEFRNQGFAKEAVARVMSKMAECVDEVRAFIVPGNEPSMAVARQLHIPVVHKVASVKSATIPAVASRLTRFLKHPATKAVTDYVIPAAGTYAIDKYWYQPHYGEEPVVRGLAGATNMAALSALSGAIRKGKGKNALGLMGGLLAKELGISGFAAAPKIPGAIDAFTQAQQRANIPTAPSTATPETPMWQKALPYVGAGAIGLGGVLALSRLAKGVRDMGAQQSRGKVMLRLPTKEPGDQETTVELPIQELGLTEKMIGNIGRDTRRKIRQESKDRTWHRKNRRLITNAEPDEKGRKAAAWRGILRQTDKCANFNTPVNMNALVPKGGGAGAQGPQRGGFTSTINTQGSGGDGTLESLSAVHDQQSQLAKQQQQKSQKELSDAQKELREHRGEAESAQESLQDLKDRLSKAEVEAHQYKAMRELMKEKMENMRDMYGEHSKLRDQKGDADWHPVIKHVASRAEQTGKRIQALMGKLAAVDPMLLMRMCWANKKKASVTEEPSGLDKWQQDHPLLNAGATFIPGVGTALMGRDAIKDFGSGNYLSGALNTVGAGLSVIPLVGGLLGKGTGMLAKGINAYRGLSTTKQIGTQVGVGAGSMMARNDDVNAAGQPTHFANPSAPSMDGLQNIWNQYKQAAVKRAVANMQPAPAAAIGDVSSVAKTMNTAREALHYQAQPNSVTATSSLPSRTSVVAPKPPRVPGASERALNLYGAEGKQYLENKYMPMSAYEAPYDAYYRRNFEPKGWTNMLTNLGFNFFGRKPPGIENMDMANFAAARQAAGGAGQANGNIASALAMLFQQQGMPLDTQGHMWGGIS